MSKAGWRLVYWVRFLLARGRKVRAQGGFFQSIARALRTTATERDAGSRFLVTGDRLTLDDEGVADNRAEQGDIDVVHRAPNT